MSTKETIAAVAAGLMAAFDTIEMDALRISHRTRYDAITGGMSAFARWEQGPDDDDAAQLRHWKAVAMRRVNEAADVMSQVMASRDLGGIATRYARALGGLRALQANEITAADLAPAPKALAPDAAACPFCGTSDRLTEKTTGGDSGFGWKFTTCLRCGAEGPRDSATTWTTRATAHPAADAESLPAEYRKAVTELATKQEMSEAQVLRAAIRLYQSVQLGNVTITHAFEGGKLAAHPVAPAKPRGMKAVGAIHHDALGHPIARLLSAFDANGDGLKVGEPLYVAAHPVAGGAELSGQQIDAAINSEFTGDAGAFCGDAQVVTLAELRRVVRHFAAPPAKAEALTDAQVNELHAKHVEAWPAGCGPNEFGDIVKLLREEVTR